MYDSNLGSSPQSERCKDPDWEAEVAKATADLSTITNFKDALIDFIDVIGTHAMRRNKDGSIPELLGTVEIDIMDREKTIARLMKKLPV